jgi:hypothetical protein
MPRKGRSGNALAQRKFDPAQANLSLRAFARAAFLVWEGALRKCAITRRAFVRDAMPQSLARSLEIFNAGNLADFAARGPAALWQVIRRR